MYTVTVESGVDGCVKIIERCQRLDLGSLSMPLQLLNSDS